MNSTKQFDPKKKNINNNFLEALRSLGEDMSDAAVNDLAGGVAEDAFNQIFGRTKSGELKPNQPLNLNQIEPKERQIPQFRSEFLDIRREERLIFTKAEQETKAQIAAILDELKKLALSTKNLAKEIEVAAVQVPVEPGIYHIGFFEKLRQTLIILRKKIDESATWLESFNQRSKKRNYFWGQFKKSGTKFLLSQERYMATQAG